ncbi:MAG: 3-hydroxyacyl-ACP dehydratase FabZ family protein [Bacteriovoracaceae bacterium]
MFLNQNQILEFLPHRDPFLFIDSVLSVTVKEEISQEKAQTATELVGCQVVANYRTKEDHPIFKGHFPGNPILPGVVQVEMMAQATSFVLFKLEAFKVGSQLDVALVSVNNAKFRKPVLPEMDLEIKSEVLKFRGPMMSSHCQIFHEGTLVSEADVMATVKF